jgi:hypothetical protein
MGKMMMGRSNSTTTKIIPKQEASVLEATETLVLEPVIIKEQIPGETITIETVKEVEVVKEVQVETIKEVIVEVIKEVPVEVIREVEKLVEVIKEVPVEVIKTVEVRNIENEIKLKREVLTTTKKNDMLIKLMIGLSVASMIIGYVIGGL